MDDIGQSHNDRVAEARDVALKALRYANDRLVAVERRNRELEEEAVAAGKAFLTRTAERDEAQVLCASNQQIAKQALLERDVAVVRGNWLRENMANEAGAHSLAVAALRKKLAEVEVDRDVARRALDAVSDAFAVFPSGSVVYGEIADVRAALKAVANACKATSKDSSLLDKLLAGLRWADDWIENGEDGCNPCPHCRSEAFDLAGKDCPYHEALKLAQELERARSATKSPDASPSGSPDAGSSPA